MAGETPESLEADQTLTAEEYDSAPDASPETPGEQLERLQAWLDESDVSSVDLEVVLGERSADLLQGVDDRTRSAIQAAFLLGQTSKVDEVRELIQPTSTEKLDFEE